MVSSRDHVVSDVTSSACRSEKCRHSASAKTVLYFRRCASRGRTTVEKLDLKKQWKHLYQPKPGMLAEVSVPPLTYLMVDGEGDPNTSTAFQQAVEALFSLSYALKFSLKKSPKPVDYGVMPLEGNWWADDPRAFHQADKSSWKWTAMILQPDFIAKAQVDAAFAEVRRKKNPAALDRVRFETLEEGPSVQILYTGPFSEEGRRSSACTTSFTGQEKSYTGSTTRST